MKLKLNYACMLITGTMLFAACSKETSNPTPPVATAGDFQTVQLPTNTVTVTGSGTTTNGSIVGYLWSLVSGPNVPVITNPGLTATTVSSLEAGTYIFQFEVTDNAGLAGVDTVSVLVKPAVQQTVTIQPANNTSETHADSYNLTGGSGDTEIEIGSWTISGTPTNWRSFIKFDQSVVPPNATILNAQLYLYSMPVPGAGDLIHAQFGTANSFYVERITGSWNPAVFTYNSLPATTTVNRISAPQSVSANENSIIDVTSILQDMQINGNYGFAFRLQNETYYNMRLYASSYYSDATLHPKLVITYQ